MWSEVAPVIDASALPSTLGTNEVAAAVKCHPQTLCRIQAPGAPGAHLYRQHSSRVGREFRWNVADLVNLMNGGAVDESRRYFGTTYVIAPSPSSSLSPSSSPTPT